MEKNTKSKINGSKIEKLKLTFCGGVGSVTGANFLLTGPLVGGEASGGGNDTGGDSSKTFSVLVDCGLEQGTHDAETNNHKDFLYNPVNAEVLLITHAHMDHIGRVPKLVRDGFKGIIYSTPETKKLAVVMLADALKLTTQAALRNGLPPLYEDEDVVQAFKLWQTIPYHQHHQLSPGYSVYLKDSGHVLGSCMFELTYTAEGEDRKRKIVFTGDLGNSPTPLLKDTEPVTDADYILMESVYGDKNHEDRAHRLDKLAAVIKENHEKGGVLLMPIFSLEKAQEILFEIHKLFDEHKLPRTNVYLDSPLAIKLTDIYKTMISDFNQTAQADAHRGHKHDIFSFPGLHVIQNSEESKNIVREQGSKIIMAGSGMSNGGRIQHHELNYLGDPRNTIVFIGYQAVGTMGRMIQEGASEVEIMGNRVAVRAKLEKIDGYSSHKDSDHLVEFVEQSAETLRKVFVVMGETKSSLFLAQRIRDYLGINAVHPEEGDTIVLE